MKNFRARIRHFTKADDGQVIVLVAASLLVLMLMAGLGVDVGYLRYEKQQMQKAADAGALAGATTLLYGGNYKQAAYNDTNTNGFPNGVNNIVVTPISPPTDGPFASQTGFVEVTITQPQPLFFMKVGGFTTATVTTRAVASSNGQSSGCVYSLDPSGSGAINMNGTGNVGSTCGIRIDSNSGNALQENGASGEFQAVPGGIGVVGGWSSGQYNPQPVNIFTFNDPLQNVAEPSYSPSCNQYGTNGLKITTNGTFYLQPGTYCNGISIAGGATVYFAPGLYVLLGGGMTSGGNDTLISQTGGVTFYNTFNSTYTYGPIQIAGTSTTTLGASQTATAGTGMYSDIAGVLFFQDRLAPTNGNYAKNSFDGTNGEKYTGILYFPTTNLTYSGTTGLTQSTDIIAWDITFNGNINISDYGATNSNSPLRGSLIVQ